MAKKNNKDLKVSSSQTLIYSGNVKIQVKDKHNHIIQTIERHNLGTNYLFRFLLNCLAGNYYKNERPRYFYLIYHDDAQVDPNIYDYAIQVGVPVNIANVVKDEEDNTYYVSYQVSIPIYRNNTKFGGLVVYSYENNINVDTSSHVDNNYSMRVDFEEPVEVVEETNLIITWQLTIQDASSTQE